MLRTNWKRSTGRRKKHRACFFTKNKVDYIDYKNVEFLKRFLSKSGQILPRSVTGTKALYQTALATAIKRARFLGLLGFVSLDSPEIT